ncbi:MAG: D-alanyl-D-alanine carboxypeptidase [Gammaproteobacteria bacterium]|nr:D-alanyl-D-alanine carboxypeptidase [Gammaproteobacteria bacterium]
MRTTYLLLFFLFSSPALGFDVPIPGTGPIAGTSHILVDFQSQQTIVEKNADERLEPASITKLMTAYIVFSELSKGSIALDDRVSVSEKAYRMDGSRMFIEPNKPVTVEELLLGMIIQSGNDASVALAEHVAGTEASFAELMNHYGRQLGLDNSNFVNSTGWPHEDHYSTARDIATLAAALIRDFPQYYDWYSQRVYKYNGIEQYNRNTLLGRDDSVDGIKTGHTNSAGYCLASSAIRDGRRLIAVVLGTDSKRQRADASYSLLNYGFRHFETHTLYEAGKPLTSARVWKGSAKEVTLGIDRDLHVTIPRGSYDSLEANMDLQATLVAPLQTSDELGSVRVNLGDQVLAEATLRPLTEISTGGIVRRAIDEVMLWFE